jgi:phosphate starvation-inducible PhoH-like protein
MARSFKKNQEEIRSQQHHKDVDRRRSRTPNLRLDDLVTIDPMTKAQAEAFADWKNNNHLILSGAAGTGKTFIALYLALETILDRSSFQKKIYIVRSIVPTREIGFLPGTIDEKLEAYKAPYIGICAELFEDGDAYNKLVENNRIEFLSTSFIRGTTMDDAIIIVDECQNLNFHELDSIVTRCGKNTRIILSGDYYQSDFTRNADKAGILEFLNIFEQIKDVCHIQFIWSDIVRSDFVREYIMTKELIRRNNGS